MRFGARSGRCAIGHRLGFGRYECLGGPERLHRRSDRRRGPQGALPGGKLLFGDRITAGEAFDQAPELGRSGHEVDSRPEQASEQAQRHRGPQPWRLEIRDGAEADRGRNRSDRAHRVNIGTRGVASPAVGRAVSQFDEAIMFAACSIWPDVEF